MKPRKPKPPPPEPRIGKEQAKAIALQYAAQHEFKVVIDEVQVRDTPTSRCWTVFLPCPSMKYTDPGGSLVSVHKQTGEADLLPSF